MRRMKHIAALGATLLLTASMTAAHAAPALMSTHRPFTAPGPRFSRAVAFDISRPLRNIRRAHITRRLSPPELEIRPDRGPVVKPRRFVGDPVRQWFVRSLVRPFVNAPSISSPLLTFEGLKNTDNTAVGFPFLVVPPDPNAAVGPNNIVEMVNLVFAVYDKQGNLLTGPTLLGDLWAGFAIPDCTDESGDPVVLYDRHEDRWLLTQFTTRGNANPNAPNFLCVAISQTPDPTGPYFRYAFTTGLFFPDYPKFSVWSDSYLATSRDFPQVSGNYGISVYALEKQAMVDGKPNAGMFHFFLDSGVVPISQIGDGLLPADVDSPEQPNDGAPAPVVGTMDDDGPYGAPFDALNIYNLTVHWGQQPPNASLNLVAQLPVAPFNSTFPCSAPPPASATRSCIPQPNTTRKIDILSYRQRPTFRLAYRIFNNQETMVTNQSVQAGVDASGAAVAGVRWYQINRTGGVYSVFQQGTYAPSDGVDRWMGSIAMDAAGNIGLGFSVSNATNVFPGIRYTGRLAGDPLGQMTLGEAVLQTGFGSQLTAASRWGDYTDLNIDPVDDCTFWYVNEYYQTTSLRFWHTRIGSFKLPRCIGQNGQ